MELDDLEDKLQSAFPEIRTKKDRKSGIRTLWKVRWQGGILNEYRPLTEEVDHPNSALTCLRGGEWLLN